MTALASLLTLALAAAPLQQSSPIAAQMAAADAAIGEDVRLAQMATFLYSTQMMR